MNRIMTESLTLLFKNYRCVCSKISCFVSRIKFYVLLPAKTSEEETKTCKAKDFHLIDHFASKHQNDQAYEKKIRLLIIFALIVINRYYIDSLTFVLVGGAHHLQSRLCANWFGCLFANFVEFLRKSQYFESEFKRWFQ